VAVLLVAGAAGAQTRGDVVGRAREWPRTRRAASQAATRSRSATSHSGPRRRATDGFSWAIGGGNGNVTTGGVDTVPTSITCGLADSTSKIAALSGELKTAAI
jgi:hypothetical protein